MGKGVLNLESAFLRKSFTVNARIEGRCHRGGHKSEAKNHYDNSVPEAPLLSLSNTIFTGGRSGEGRENVIS